MLIRLKQPVNADRDLTSLVEVFASYVPNGEHPVECKLTVDLGDGTKDLDASANGEFLLAIAVGSQWFWKYIPVNTILQDRPVLESDPFIVPRNTAVTAYVQSPNGADSDVDVTATIWMVSNPPVGIPVRAAAGATATAFDVDDTECGVDAPTDADFYNGGFAAACEGPNAGAARQVTDWLATPRVTFSSSVLPAAPDTLDLFVIHGIGSTS